VNGILDSFVTSVATPAQLRAQSLWMLFFTVIYGVTAWAMLREFELGAAGLVGANMVNMVSRIVWSAQFLRRWVQDNDQGEKRLWGKTIHDALPSKYCTIIAGLVVLGLSLGQHGHSTSDGGQLDRYFLGLLTTGTATLGSAILFFERNFLQQSVLSMLPQRLAAKLSRFMREPPKNSVSSHIS